MYIHNNTPFKLLCLGGVLFYLLGTLFAATPHVAPLKPVVKTVYVRVADKKSFLRVSATVYYPTGQPTYDGTPVINRAIPHLAWCAVSHDLLTKTNWRFGDTLLINGGNLPARLKGLYVLHDLTNSRLRNRVDILVPTHSFSDRWDHVQVRRFSINELSL